MQNICGLYVQKSLSLSIKFKDYFLEMTSENQKKDHFYVDMHINNKKPTSI